MTVQCYEGYHCDGPTSKQNKEGAMSNNNYRRLSLRDIPVRCGVPLYVQDRLSSGFRVGRLTMNRHVVALGLSVWSTMYR